MDIALIKLVVDTGLLILIWIVQLVIYPSFIYYDEKNLVKWHIKYTSNISFIVVPLMLGQSFIAIFQLFSNSSLITVAYFILVLSSWLFTFILFVPIHSKISQGLAEYKMLKKLVKNNWIRTFIWTTIFALNFFKSIFIIE